MKTTVKFQPLNGYLLLGDVGPAKGLASLASNVGARRRRRGREYQVGRVVAVSKDAPPRGSDRDSQLSRPPKVGAQVLFSPWSKCEVKLAGVHYRLVGAEELLGVLE